jgi:hypothetical protein
MEEGPKVSGGTCKNWNVVSGGPSRAFIQQADLLPDSPVVTVNRAVDIIDRGIVVDFAAFADPPNAIVKLLGLEKYLRPPIQVWCPRPAFFPDKGVMKIFDMVTLWEPFLPASVGLRTMPFGTLDQADKSVSRYTFATWAAIARVLMFKPERVRILCADMMGSWAPGLTEAECEMQQSLLEQARRELGSAQRQVVATKGENPGFVRMRDNAQAEVDSLLKRGDPVIFKRWEHERHQLKELEKRAATQGTTFEFVTPREAVLA